MQFVERAHRLVLVSTLFHEVGFIESTQIDFAASVNEFGIIDIIVIVRFMKLIRIVISAVAAYGRIAAIKGYFTAVKSVINILRKLCKHNDNIKFISEQGITAVFVFVNSAVIRVASGIRLQFFVSVDLFAVGKIVFIVKPVAVFVSGIIIG